MKLSKNGIKVLTAQYRAVLKKCLLINMGLFFCATGAMATDAISLNGKTGDINGNTDIAYKFSGWQVNLGNSIFGDLNGINTKKSVDEIATDLKKASDIHYQNLAGKPTEVSKVELSGGAVLNLENARIMIAPEQDGDSIDAIFVKDSTINLKNSSLDASTDEGDKIFNTVFNNATLNLVSSELPIDGDVSFKNGSTLSISAPNYFSEEEIINMLQNEDNAKKIAEAIQGKDFTHEILDTKGYKQTMLGLPSNVELAYTNSDGTEGIIKTDDMSGEQKVEVMRLTIDNSKFIIGGKEKASNDKDRARVTSDSQIIIQNNSDVILNNRGVLAFEEDDEYEEGDNPFGTPKLVINHSHVTLNDNSELNVANRGNATTTIENNSQIFMNDNSQMNLNAVTITDSQIHMKDNATLTMDSVVLQKAAIHGTGTNKVIIAGENVTTFEDTSLEVTDDEAIQVNKNGHFKIQAKNSEVKIAGNSADNSVIALEGGNGDKTTVDISGGTQSVTIDGAIISANKDNVVNFDGNVNLNGLLDPLTANVTNGVMTHTYYADDIDFNLNDRGTLKYANDKYLYDEAKHNGKYALNSITFNGGTLDIANGTASVIKLAKLTLSKDSNIKLDVDLANNKMDRFSDDTNVDGSAKLNISELNLVSDAKSEETTVTFTENETLKNAVNYKNGTIKGYSSIYSYDVEYNDGDFTFTRGGGSSVSDYNPAVYAGSVVGQTLATIQSTISQTAFSSLNNTLPQKDNAWVSVIGFDDTVDMKSFNNVDSEMYSLVGGVNSDAKHFDNFDATYGLYAGYVNSEQKYDGNKIEQNGGYIGLDSVLSKGNAELLASVNTGYIRNEDKHSFGNDKFDTYFTGIAVKAGYNYDLNNGLSVIPSLYAGYTFVNNEDYTSKSGVKIKNDNLHLFEVAPGVKVNKDFNNGWTGYAQAKYAFIMDNGGDADVNNINLPNISAKDYVEYGLGANKALNEAWNLSAEINRRDGGREGWNGNLNIKYNF